MSLALREEDRRAVDLILDRAPAAQQGDGGNSMTFATTSAAHAGASNERVAAAERVLNMLEAMPGGEPAGDLLQRTLERVDAQTAAPMRGQGAMIDANRPVA